MLEASVARIRSSASANAFGRSSSTQSTPTTRSPVRIGTPSHELDSAPRLTAPSVSACGFRAEAERLPRADDDGGQAWSVRQVVGLDADTVIDLVREGDGLGGRVVDPDEHRLAAEERADPLADEIDDRIELELLRQCAADLVDDRELRGPCVGFGEEALGLIEQPGVVEGHAHARGHRGEQALVGLVERMLLQALDDDDAGDVVAGADGGTQPGRRDRAPDHDRAEPLELGLGAAAERLPGPDHVRREPGAGGRRIRVDQLSLVDLVSPLDGVARSVVKPDRDAPGGEDIAQAFADELDDRVEVELAGERITDLVDQRQLRVALARLLDGPRPGQRRGHVIGHEGQDLDVPVGVVTARLVGLDDDDADRGPLPEQRGTQPVLAVHANDRDLPGRDEGFPAILRDERGSTGPQHVGRQSHRRRRPRTTPRRSDRGCPGRPSRRSRGS